MEYEEEKTLMEINDTEYPYEPEDCNECGMEHDAMEWVDGQGWTCPECAFIQEAE